MALLLDRNSKADTRLLCNRLAGMELDLSQWRTDLTDNTTYLTGVDFRLAVRSPREISVVVDLSTADDRVLLNWGRDDGSTYLYRITINSGAPIFGHNDADLVTVTPPNLSGSAKPYLLHWSTEYDVRAATWYSEIAICDIGAGDWTVVRVDHDEPDAPNLGDEFTIIGYGAGTNAFTAGLAAVDFVRIGCRFHSTTEGKEDWVAESSAPSVAGDQLLVELAPSSPSFFTADPAEDVSDAILDEGTFAGPIEFAAVVNANAGRRRLRSALVNLAITAPPTLDNTYTPAGFFTEMGAGAFKVHAGHIFYRLYQGRRVHVRVHAQTWIAAGAPMGTAVAITLSAHSLQDLGAAAKATSKTLAISDDHTSTGVGEWYDLDDLIIGINFFAVGYKFGTGTGASYLRMKIKAITMEPYELTLEA